MGNTGKKRKAREREAVARAQQPPPLPHGLPPRPPNSPPGQTTFLGNGESYRPGRDNPPSMREFRGRVDDYQRPYERSRSPLRQYSSTSSYRPAYDAPGVRPYNDDRSYHPDPNNYENYNRAPPSQYRRIPSPEVYRPSNYPPPSSRNDGFNFQYDAPQGLDFNQRNQSNRPRSPPRAPQRTYGGNHKGNSQGNARGGHQNGGYRGGRGGYAKVGASDRAFLKTNRAPTPELMTGMEEAINAKYVAVEDDSSEDGDAEMEISEDEGDSNPQTKKKTRTDTKAADGDSVPLFAPGAPSIPKWSNPDPYTVLPPVDETQRKKKDIVELIRKSRVATENASKPEAPTDDFLSFDFNDDKEPAFQAQLAPGVQGAPTGPRSGNILRASGSSFNPINSNKQAKPDVIDLSVSPLQEEKFPRPLDALRPIAEAKGANKSTKQGQSIAQGKKPTVIDLTSDQNLASRKRTANDELKPPPDLHSFQNGIKPKSSGQIVSSWAVVQGEPSCPWIGIDHSGSANMGVWLHKEIMDFYNHVKPQAFEGVIRTNVVHELRSKIQSRYDVRSDIQCFGSFPAGLYLPTADMDLVLVSDEFMRTGRKVFNNAKKEVFRFAEFIKRENLALYNQVETIGRAKVPIVKYVDKVTGLKVDISFENDTGLIANKTFQEWKRKFPAMPILVTLIKHFLAMRGLNEPVNGGIGGFSVICLVVSLLQHMPQVQSSTMKPEHHLGEVLMEFFDLYGNQFNVATTAISLNPVGYISKAAMGHSATYKGQQAKFTILDPNRQDNDISGGSSNTAGIRKAFSDAYNKLQHRMGEFQHAEDRKFASILDVIIGGNYSSFRLQRAHLQHVHEQFYGPV